METQTDQPGAASEPRKPFYRRAWFLVAVVLVAVPMAAVAWYLGSPLFIDKTVVEAFPVVTTAPTEVEDVQLQDEPVSDESTNNGSTPTGDSEGDGVVDEPAESAEEVPPAPTGPVALLSGSFAGADRSHQGSGDVTIYELEDGSRVLRFENLDVTNGPDLHVIVSPVGDPQSRDDVSAAGYIDLGSLKGNLGDQNYEIPADFDLAQAGSIVIYCQPFHVIFATAALGSV